MGMTDPRNHEDTYLEVLGPKRYSHVDLEKFTSNFSESNIVGSGGYGVVYKGHLPNGVHVAIKKLETRTTLLRHLWLKSKQWAGNVLLDKNLSPKITDFEMAKLINRDVSHVPLTRTRGTQGYNAPETWMPRSQVTYKCDVYSFGMLLFEVLGKRNNGEEEYWFPGRVWDSFKSGLQKHMLRDIGITKENRRNAELLAMVAFWCAQFKPEDRPAMSDVVLMLEKRIQVVAPPLLFPFWQSSTSSMLPSPEEVSEDDLQGSNDGRYDFLLFYVRANNN
ncbi:hypothetical protein AQUCO_01200118v1 [Aquilegia coerulea]|uniref:Protein kinase domain-containing protein n=1 Tax=Aquilegia coerulea TaxID=218851 RepID=A0A2G5E4J5_AQUCA|nr:hypothetical protein AQUCO_01200118v1 [Aquilegia coerulea]